MEPDQMSTQEAGMISNFVAKSHYLSGGTGYERMISLHHRALGQRSLQFGQTQKVLL